MDFYPVYKLVYFWFIQVKSVNLKKNKQKMKEVSEFHFIQSEHEHFVDLQYQEDFFEEEKIAYNYEDQAEKEIDQQNILKSPKPKRGRKLSIKSNSKDNGTLKLSKVKQKKIKPLSTDKQKNPNQMIGHWSVDENKRYHWFLQIHHSHFMNRSLRRMDRIFTTMAKFVGTREAQQCRSHHQKMEKKHKTFSKILLALRINYYGCQNQIDLKEEIERNVQPHQITMIEPLLTEDYLLENLLMKDTLSVDQHQKQEERSSNNQPEEKPASFEIQIEKPQLPLSSHDIIEEVLAPEIQSSKNYYKFLNQNHDRNNILDDGYESNLPFNGFF